MKAKEFVLGVKFRLDWYKEVLHYTSFTCEGKTIEILIDEKENHIHFEKSTTGIRLWDLTRSMPIVLKSKLFPFSKLTLVP